MKKKKVLLSVLFLSLMLSACNRKNDFAITEKPEGSHIILNNLEQKNDVDGEYNLLDVFNEQKLEDCFGFYEKAAFIISDGENMVVYNDELANTEISPYSTFKIPNSMIALETGVITKEDSYKKWDGTIYSREELNRDHDLASAIENSVVWYYKELANDIGEENMQKYLKTMSYGNQDISGGLDQFWLGSSLKITPIQQIEFLIKFYNNEFNFSEETIDIVKTIIKQKDLDFDIYGKSGSSGEGMSWFVGYVVKDDKPYFFTTYLEDEKNGLQAKTYTITMFKEILSTID